MQNQHPAMRRLNRTLPIKNGLFHIYVTETVDGQSSVIVDQTKSDLRSSLLARHSYGKINSSTVSADIESFHTRTYPSAQFDLTTVLAFENLLNAEGIAFHLVNDDSRQLWQAVMQRPDLKSMGCDKPSWLSFARWEICSARFEPQLIKSNVEGIFGWSDPEFWGMWAIDQRPRAEFYLSDSADHQLDLEATPYCVEGKKQSAVVRINQTEIGRMAWPDCNTQTRSFPIPQSILQQGKNELSFEFAYAISPAAVPSDPNDDPRSLSTSFSKLLIRR